MVTALILIGIMIIGTIVLIVTKSTPTLGKRFVKGIVLSPEGKPMTGVAVFLVNIERSSLLHLKIARKMEGWHWVTDSSGEFTAYFGLHRTRRGNEELFPPGEGIFHFVVMPTKQHAGAISPPILNYRKPSNVGIENEWGHSSFLDDTAFPLTLQLSEGIVLKGIVVNTNETPIDNIIVGINHDLHADTRTLSGGEIFERVMKTQLGGKFYFTNVYPAPFNIHVTSTEAATDTYATVTWIKTANGSDAPWIDDCLDRVELIHSTEIEKEPSSSEISPDTAQDNTKENHKLVQIFMKIMISVGPQYKCSGVVSDEDGQPVAGAEITCGISQHKVPKTYSDFNTFERFCTDARGHYDFSLLTPWIRSLNVVRFGYLPFTLQGSDDSPLQPGVYNFILRTIVSDKAISNKDNGNENT